MTPAVQMMLLESRQKFRKLRFQMTDDKQKRLQLIYTPTHASWLNQIEIWFSLLVRKLLRRSSFSSLEDLEKRILDFINYFNQTMSKPIQWLYSPRPLREEIPPE